MDLKALETLARSEVLWAVICFILAVIGYRTIRFYILELKIEGKGREDKLIELYANQKEESKEREDRLMAHVEKTTETLQGIEHQMEIGFTHVNGRIDDVWDKVQGR